MWRDEGKKREGTWRKTEKGKAKKEAQEDREHRKEAARVGVGGGGVVKEASRVSSAQRELKRLRIPDQASPKNRFDKHDKPITSKRSQSDHHTTLTPPHHPGVGLSSPFPCSQNLVSLWPSLPSFALSLAALSAIGKRAQHWTPKTGSQCPCGDALRWAPGRSSPRPVAD